jgi:predicted  nucleic acid-binding Zn-ribbon protein
VDMVEKEISDLEEEILKTMDAVEGVEGKVKEKEAAISQKQEEIKKEKEKLEQRQKALQESLKGTRSKRENLVAGVEAGLLSQYDRIRTHKGGLAIAPIDDESCSACHMALPPQLVNEVIGGKVKSCPSCSRLLYWNE